VEHALGLTFDDLQVGQSQDLLVHGFLGDVLLLAVEEVVDEGVLERELLAVLFDVLEEEGVPAVDGEVEEVLLDAVLGQRHEVDLVEVDDVQLQEHADQLVQVVLVRKLC
jgi:hypothetical protein